MLNRYNGGDKEEENEEEDKEEKGNNFENIFKIDCFHCMCYQFQCEPSPPQCKSQREGEGHACWMYPFACTCLSEENAHTLEKFYCTVSVAFIKFSPRGSYNLNDTSSCLSDRLGYVEHLSSGVCPFLGTLENV